MMRDYDDGGETGAGRRLLGMLVENEHTDITVIVIRYYGGKHLGPRRFEIITDLAKRAISKLGEGSLHTSTLPLRQMLEAVPHRRSRKTTAEKSVSKKAHKHHRRDRSEPCQGLRTT